MYSKDLTVENTAHLFFFLEKYLLFIYSFTLEASISRNLVLMALIFLMSRTLNQMGLWVFGALSVHFKHSISSTFTMQGCEVCFMFAEPLVSEVPLLI